MFSILHISDLHRSRDEPVDNDSLVAALLADCDRYIGETPVVPFPEAIIVSGDLIQGAPMHHPRWQEEMSDQYRVAGDFLEQLAQRFLNGDRSKLIIVPGNHDVCWNTSISSMERVLEADYPDNVRQALLEPSSNYRWSWKELALYRIQDTDIYSKRTNAYWDFAENFYAGVSLLKPVDRNRGFQLFELNDRRIVVAGFDSINGNDCFAYAGAIPQGAIARCNLALRDIPHSYDLRIAVWHHSIYGPPQQEDYVKVEQVHEMIGLGFQLGLHGHQHVAAATTHFVHLNESQSMAVVSAGSLCAGFRDLPRGVNRQYNVVVIENDFHSGRVHVREMAEGGQFSRKKNGAFSQGFVEIAWKTSTDVMGREINANEENIRRATLQAEDALRKGDPVKAIQLLEGIEFSSAIHARKIAIQSALRLESWEMLSTLVAQPQSNEEAIFLITALIQINDLEQAEVILSIYNDIDTSIRNELQGKIEVKKMLRSTWALN
jgi:Calcineurin-like phosphoesterase